VASTLRGHAMHNALMRRLALRGWAFLLVAGFVLLPAAGLAAQPSGKVVDLIQIKGLIDPPTASYLENRIAAAQDAPADEAIIIELDSSGGVVDSIPDIVRRIVSSRVPVVVWVAPRGASAASAGAVILEAGSLAYMAGATQLGAAMPVNLNSTAESAAEATRTTALITRLASLRGRTVPTELPSPGASITSAGAARSGAIDGVASSLAEVLRRMDGRSISVAGGGSVTLETWDQTQGEPSVGFRFEEMNLVARVLHAVVSPEIAFLLLLIGAFGLIFEIYNPGIGLAAIIGVAALAASFYAMNLLPTNWPGVLVVVIAVGLFVVDVQLSGFGLWSAGGVLGLIVGGGLMFSGAPAAAQLSPWAIVIAVALSLLFFVSVMTAALRVRLRRPIAGQEGIVGTVGVARTDIAPEGTVFTKGKLWRARTMETGIAAGSRVQIKATEGLVLLVEPHSHHDGDETLPETTDIPLPPSTSPNGDSPVP
jgi:membrane-bound serine protease (ClpP class)